MFGVTVKSVSNWMVFSKISKKLVLDFCDRNEGAVVSSIIAPVSELQGDFQNITIWNSFVFF